MINLPIHDEPVVRQGSAGREFASCGVGGAVVIEGGCGRPNSSSLSANARLVDARIKTEKVMRSEEIRFLAGLTHQRSKGI